MEESSDPDMYKLKINLWPDIEQPAPEECKSDSEYKRKARKHQSDFRWKVLHCGHATNHRLGKYGAYLLWEDAMAGRNFYAPYWDKIQRAITNRYHDSQSWELAPIYANMLRSEHIPFNFFVPMMDDLDAAAKAFNALIQEESIAQIISIKIEYAPEKQFALNDGTAFDTFVLYRHNDGSTGGIGIEIKYTEAGYPLKRGSKEERDIMNGENRQYIDITHKCGYYTNEVLSLPLSQSPLVKNEFRQIWRNHILGASMMENNNIEHPLKHFNSVTIYPNSNTHFTKTIPRYEQMLTDRGRKTFCGITYENFFKILSKFYSSTDFCNWIVYLGLRYEF